LTRTARVSLIARHAWGLYPEAVKFLPISVERSSEFAQTTVKRKPDACSVVTTRRDVVCNLRLPTGTITPYREFASQWGNVVDRAQPDAR
jgi:hypothetical protein